MHEGTSFLTSLRAISRELPKAYESAPPWLFIIIPFKVLKMGCLWSKKKRFPKVFIVRAQQFDITKAWL